MDKPAEKLKVSILFWEEREQERAVIDGRFFVAEYRGRAAK